jgi:hypothetical protein
MKKIILFVFLTIFSVCAFAITPDSKSISEKNALPVNQENKMSDQEISNLTKHASEIGYMNKSSQTIIVQDEHRTGRGHGMYRENRRNGGVYIGGAGLLLLIILVIVLV